MSETTVPRNKTQLKKVLVAERKTMREKQKQSALMRKTLNIYNAMAKRAEEKGETLDFTLADLREGVQKNIGTECPYCHKVKLAVSTLTIDHGIPISRGGTFERKNIAVCCRSCNFQKGSLTFEEFLKLHLTLKEMPPEAEADVRRRLTIGGKWSWK